MNLGRYGKEAVISESDLLYSIHSASSIKTGAGGSVYH